MPVVHLVVGPNGAGKTTFFEKILAPATGLPFVNADVIARAMWPGHEEARGHDAARLAEERRAAMMTERRSFVAETVFSHPSKLDFVRQAKAAGYLVHLHVILVPVDLAVKRVELRHAQGGHSVPEGKIRKRFDRLWTFVSEAIALADEAVAYDNTRVSRPYREVARYQSGKAQREDLPPWSPLAPATRGRARSRRRRRP